MIEELRRLAQETAAAVPTLGAQPEADGQQRKANILVVDDQPANLKLLEDFLVQQGHLVRSFPRGRLALEGAQRNPPDLILLDINMPEMDGFEVCRQLKANEKLARIPVLFLSALSDTSDKVNAFRAGGVDYISKPAQLEEVQARVETHLLLYRARQVERDLLENTLNGAVKALSEFAQLMSPKLTERSAALRSMLTHMTAKLHLADAWQYELAATLCLIGCITLPQEVFENAYFGKQPTQQELDMFGRHPEVAFQLLSRIPRLENVAEMIRLQQQTICDGSISVVAQGAGMLRTAQELDRRVLRGTAFQTACEQLRSRHDTYPLRLVEALKDYVPARVHFEVKRLQAAQLLPGMMLEDDVITRDGSLTVIVKGTALTVTLIERVQNFARTRGVRDPIQVRAPQGVYMDDLQKA